MTQLLMTFNTFEVTITSLGIAELVGSRHDSVKRTIETLANKNVIQQPPLVEISTATKPVSVYVFSGERGRLDSYVVVVQMSPQSIAAIVEMWGKSTNTLKDIFSALESFDVPEDMRDMYVYAIREPATGHIKLGISHDPESRLKQLQIGNSQKLELVAFRRAVNGFDDEKQVHSLNKDLHVRGEWFGADATLEYFL